MRIIASLAVLFTATVCSAQIPFEAAQQRMHSTPLESVLEPEVFVPKPPTVFSAGGQTFLCYELLITNMENKPFRLERVHVYAEGSASVLYEQDSAELKRSLNHPGWAEAQGQARDAQLLRGGERVVDFIWIALPSASLPPPKTLVHTITLRRMTAQASITLPAGRIDVTGQAVTIDPPLRGENWAALNGPSRSSQHRESMDTFNGQTDFAERFAIDWVQIDKDGLTSRGDRLNLQNYFCYGQPVYAVADATVTFVQDGLPNGRPEANGKPADPKVPMTLDTIAGNHVILDLGGGVYAAYAHLQPGSIRVKVGNRVKEGDVLGLIGDSGNSTEPHLHFQLMDANSVLAAQGLPYAFRTFNVRFGARIVHDDLKPFPLPQPLLHKGEIPLENEIVEFPKAP
jgi:hypothetical protein